MEIYATYLYNSVFIFLHHVVNAEQILNHSSNKDCTPKKEAQQNENMLTWRAKNEY